MSAERQLIGSLLLDSSRIDDLKLIDSSMFVDCTLGDIYSIYEHADGVEVNQLTIIPKIITSFRTESQAKQLLVDLITEHDASISDESCEEIIYSNYKARKVNEIISNSVITADNVDSFLGLIGNTADAFSKKDKSDIASLSDLTLLCDDYFVESNKPKYELGFEQLDRAIGGIDEGDVAIISARPSVGKSAFALQIIRKFGKDGYKVGYFNLEMSKKQVYERSIASASGIDMTRIRRATDFLNDEKERFEKGNKKLLEEKNVRIITGAQTIKSIREIQKKEKYNVIVIDYMQLISSTGNRNNRATEVGDISRGLKKIATDFQIPVIALSQLNRASEQNKDKEPSLSELRESGDIEQDASIVIMLWNSNPDDDTEKSIKVEKSRNGYKDRMILRFDGKHMNFFDESAPTDFEDVKDNEDLPWN